MIIYTEQLTAYHFFPEVGEECFYGFFFHFGEDAGYYNEVIFPIKDVIKRRKEHANRR